MPALLSIPPRSARRQGAAAKRSTVCFALLCGLAVASSFLSVAAEADDLTVSVVSIGLP